MLKSISIKNFKSVHDLELELGRVNIFIGENGCGKTSILEAIGLASAVMSNKLDQEFLVSRGIRVTDSKLMKSAFNEIDTSKAISLKLTNTTDDFIQYDINYLNKTWQVEIIESNLKIKPTDQFFRNMVQTFVESDDLKKQFKKRSKKKKSDDSEQLIAEFAAFMSEHLNAKFKNAESNDLKTDLINTHNIQIKEKYNFENFLIYTPENYFLRRFEEEGQISPIGVRGEGLFKHIVQLVEEHPEKIKDLVENLKLINWFDGLEIPSDLSFSEMRLNIKDRFIKETISYFDQRSANEGFLYLLFYFTLFVSHETPEFFAIDNVDNSLNPKLCRELITRLIKLAKEENKQVILTTHNPAILDGLDLDDIEQRLFVVYRNADGQTKTKRVKSPKPIKGIDTVRLSEAFIRGYIGGLPKNF